MKGNHLSVILVAVMAFVSVHLVAADRTLSPSDNIQEAIDKASSGDTIHLMAGVYNQRIVVKSGVHVVGEYGKTILDGTDLNHNLIYCSADMAKPTIIRDLVLMNANSGDDGGGAYITKNVTLEHCIVELCYTTGEAGAIFNMGGLVDRCIARGCSGVDCSIWNDANGVVRNCLMHNNEPSRADWPNSGGIYNHRDGNLDGKVINCTSACNYGAEYGGWHSESTSNNILCWGNKNEPGFTDPCDYISDSNKDSKGNASNRGNSMFAWRLDTDNWGSTRPARFMSPTPFVGVPKNEAEIAAMRAADFHLTSGSFVIDKGSALLDPGAYDLDGKPRSIGEKVDIGCYEYDPNVPVVKLTDIILLQDTIELVEGESALAYVQLIPENTTQKHLYWNVEHKAIASVNNGLIKALSAGTTKLNVVSSNGRIRKHNVVIVSPKEKPYVCPEVLAAEKLMIEDYAIPSYIPMWIAREAARYDSSSQNLTALQSSIDNLQSKYMPYCVVANINGDPRYNMAFCWFTNEGITDGVIQIIAKQDATEADFAEALSQGTLMTITPTTELAKDLRYAVSTSGILKATGMSPLQTYSYVSHKGKAEHLQAGVTYSYRVGTEGYWSSIYQFRTADEEQKDFSFVYMTDSHLMNQEYVAAAQACASAMVANEKDIRFCLFPGDFIESGGNANSEWEWERWFEQSMRPMLSVMPVVPTDGNHDDSNHLNYTYHFNTDNTFNKTAKVKPQFDGITYSFMYGDALFLVYSHQDYWRGSHDYEAGTSTYLQTDVANWFREQVAAHPEAKWRIGLVHQAVFAGSGHQTDEEATLYRACMVPLFKDIELDLLIQGHDHCYEMIGPVNGDSWKVAEGSVQENNTFVTDNGTLYFIGATCGAKRYEPFSREEMEAGYERHKVENYYDLFTGKFEQPGSPSYTRFTVSADSIVANSFRLDEEGKAEPYYTYCVKRSKAHSAYVVGLPQVINRNVDGIFDMFGRNVNTEKLSPGIYIKVKNHYASKVVVR